MCGYELKFPDNNVSTSQLHSEQLWLVIRNNDLDDDDVDVASSWGLDLVEIKAINFVRSHN